jgi:hypothetical protein
MCQTRRISRWIDAWGLRPRAFRAGSVAILTVSRVSLLPLCGSVTLAKTRAVIGGSARPPAITLTYGRRGGGLRPRIIDLL